jgi:hypothetical protein
MEGRHNQKYIAYEHVLIAHQNDATAGLCNGILYAGFDASEYPCESPEKVLNTS